MVCVLSALMTRSCPGRQALRPSLRGRGVVGGMANLVSARLKGFQLGPGLGVWDRGCVGLLAQGRVCSRFSPSLCPFRPLTHAVSLGRTGQNRSQPQSRGVGRASLGRPAHAVTHVICDGMGLLRQSLPLPPSLQEQPWNPYPLSFGQGAGQQPTGPRHPFGRSSVRNARTRPRIVGTGGSCDNSSHGSGPPLTVRPQSLLVPPQSLLPFWSEPLSQLCCSSSHRPHL